MGTPVSIDVPHRLGKTGARERIKTRIGELAGHLPAGVGEVRSSWPTQDEMALEIQAMGVDVPVRLEVQETRVRVHLLLPPMLAFFSGRIGAAVREQGGKLLEDKTD